MATAAPAGSVAGSAAPVAPQAQGAQALDLKTGHIDVCDEVVLENIRGRIDKMPKGVRNLIKLGKDETETEFALRLDASIKSLLKVRLALVASADGESSKYGITLVGCPGSLKGTVEGNWSVLQARSEVNSI